MKQIRSFDLDEFRPTVDPFATDDQGNDVPVPDGADYLPASGMPVELGAMYGYLQYLTAEVGTPDTWAGLLSLGLDAQDPSVIQAQIDAAVVAATQDMVSQAKVQKLVNAATQGMLAQAEAEKMRDDAVAAAKKGMISQTGADKQKNAAVAAAKRGMISTADVKAQVDAAVAAATQDMVDKAQVQQQINGAVAGLLSPDEVQAQVEQALVKMQEAAAALQSFAPFAPAVVTVAQPTVAPISPTPAAGVAGRKFKILSVLFGKPQIPPKS